MKLSLGYLHDCFLWAHGRIDTEEHWQFVQANFSGILCLDEVHDRGQAILFATDPLNDFTIAFEQVDKNDQEHMDAFLQRLKDRGLQVVVAITDGSPLYKDSLQSHWADIEHQLCLFHVIKDVNKLILDGVRAIKNQIQRQGNKGRKRKRGRPTEKVRQQRQRRKEMTKKEQATFIWDHQYLIVRKEDELSEEEKQDLARLFQIAPELELFRRFNQQFYALFEKGITPQQARYRRTRMVNNPDYQANEFLAPSHSRPHVPDDNPFSEAQFKTMKYQPDFPQRFGSLADARSWARGFFPWYNQEHYHTGLALLTPAMVHYGQADQRQTQRQQVLQAAYDAHPERFVRGQPKVPPLPQAVWINKPKEEAIDGETSLNSGIELSQSP